MNHRLWLALALLAVALLIGYTQAADAPATSQPSPSPTKVPEVTGDWTGDWGAYDTAKQARVEKDMCKLLTCKVVQKDGVWQATFEGECGRPYKYTITMEGRQAGDVVLFKGTTDLGPKDGGVYDWIGRATEKEFTGFYTNPHHLGVFQLARTK